MFDSIPEIAIEIAMRERNNFRSKFSLQANFLLLFFKRFVETQIKHFNILIATDCDASLSKIKT